MIEEENVKETIGKWLKLQKTIKEEITLSGISKHLTLLFIS